MSKLTRNLALTFLLSTSVPPAWANVGCTEAHSAEDALPRLEQAWIVTSPDLSSPEGVAFDGTNLFISNVGGEGSDKDGEGWISRLSLDGEVLEAKWIDGLHGPKGMAVRGDKLFVSDIDAYHVIDIPTASIENTYPVEGAGISQ